MGRLEAVHLDTGRPQERGAGRPPLGRRLLGQRSACQQPEAAVGVGLDRVVAGGPQGSEQVDAGCHPGPGRRLGRRRPRHPDAVLPAQGDLTAAAEAEIAGHGLVAGVGRRAPRPWRVDGYAARARQHVEQPSGLSGRNDLGPGHPAAPVDGHDMQAPGSHVDADPHAGKSMDMQRLTGLDATFLYMETPTIHMHVASTAVFDPSTVPGGYSFEKVVELVESRLHLLPPFRRRLVQVPFELHHPLWVEDPDFDIEYHVRRAALPAPGGAAELAEFAAEFFSRPLDRSRPLWEMYAVEGLEHGHIAMITKTHHAAIDGVSGAELTVNLLDLEADPAPVPPPEEPWEPDRVPSDMELVGYAVNSLSRQPFRAAKAVRRTAGAALNVRRRNRQPDVQPPPAPFSAPRTPLNVSIGPRR